jgi:hypothetical protein
MVSRDCAALAAAVVLAAWCASAASVAAQPPTLRVGQQQPTMDGSAGTWAVGAASEKKVAQTFTVGLAGRFAEVRFAIGCADGVLDVEIQGTTPGGEPEGVGLVRRSFPADRLPTSVPASFESLRLPRRLPIAPGEVLAVVLSNDSGSRGVARSPGGDACTDGRAVFDARPNPPGWLPLSPPDEDDLPFQTVVFGRVLQGQFV